MKKLLLLALALTLAVADDRLEKLVIAGPMANVSHPMIRMVQSGALNDVAKQVEFRLWKNPDELRAMVVSGSVDIAAVPTNVAATLHNKGAEVRLISVSIWGILGMISRDDSLKTLEDFKGKTIAVPFRSDMPDLILTGLIKQAGLDPDRDFDLRYLPTPIDAMQHLILRRVDHALLAEPAISMAMRKTRSFPVSLIAPELFRSVSIEAEWGRLFSAPSKIPEAGVAAVGKTAQNAQVIDRFLEEYQKAIAWYQNNPVEAGEMAAAEIPQLQAEGVADSIAHVRFDNIRADKARPELEKLFNLMMAGDPKSVGGKLPGDNFYYGAE